MSEKEPNIELEVIEAIQAAWTKFPNMRVTQLIVNAINPSEPCPEVYHVEDSSLIELLDSYGDQ